MVKKKSQRQVRYLLSSGSPLDSKEKRKLKRELHSGRVKVVKKQKSKASGKKKSRK